MLPELREALGYRTELPFESDTFINDLSMNNISSFKTRVDTLFEEIKTKNLEKENTLFILMHLFGIIVDHCKQHKHKHTEFLEKRTFYFKEIQKKEFLEDIYILFSNIITDYLITGNINCSSKGKIINQAKSIIDKSYHKTDLTVEDIAQEVGVHANYLSQIFREEYGITVKSYILDRKLNHAKELILRDNNMMLYEVAFAVGYEDPYYFSKCFKKKYGVTPTQFMRDSYFIHSENSREPVID